MAAPNNEVNNEREQVYGPVHEPNLIMRMRMMINPIVNQLNIRNVFSTKERIAFFSILVFIIALILYNPSPPPPPPPPPSCNMSQAENRNFHKFYGINGATNHFATQTADRCVSTIFFRPAFTEIVLKPDNSASSFLTLAEYGTGKTQLRCEYAKSLNSDHYLSISIFNKEIIGYLNRYVREMGLHEGNCPNNNCLSNWSENEFAQLILSSLVTNLIDRYHNKKVEFTSSPLAEKIDLITIICYYYNGLDASELENFVNSFLDKPLNSHYLLSKVKPDQLQVLQQGTFHDIPLLEHLKSDLQKFSLLNKDPQRLHLLLSIIKGEEFDIQAGKKHLYGNVFQDLTKLSLFVKNHLNKTPVFIVDGIDENGYFFNDEIINKASLEKFGRSSVSKGIVVLTMANHFHLSLFYPKIDGIDIEKHIFRRDKFPVQKIEWNTKSLLNYADYVLQEMNKNASETRCRAFINFKTLVNMSDMKIADIIEQLHTPRALHYFMIALIKQMNDDADTVEKPFQATLDNVQASYKSSQEHSHKRHILKE
jgi:hypothetical protein